MENSEQKFRTSLVRLLKENGETFLNDDGVDLTVCELVADIAIDLLQISQRVDNDALLYEKDSIVPARLIEAAEHHEEGSGTFSLIGDFEDSIGAAWEVMTPAQRQAWLSDERVQGVFRCGYEEDREGLPIELSE